MRRARRAASRRPLGTWRGSADSCATAASASSRSGSSQIFERGDPALWAVGKLPEFFPQGAYRSCWYQPVHGGDVVCAIGIHGQLLYVDRFAGVVAVVQSSRARPDDDAADLTTLAAVRAVCRGRRALNPVA